MFRIYVGKMKVVVKGVYMLNHIHDVLHQTLGNKYTNLYAIHHNIVSLLFSIKLFILI